jgi:hypothetical protein
MNKRVNIVNICEWGKREEINKIRRKVKTEKTSKKYSEIK